MSHAIRAARVEDKELLAPWTSNTFAWGDYVVESFDGWMEQPASHVLVAVDGADRPVAVARAAMLSPRELWLQGVRVHPDWRRKGIASQLNRALQAWGADQGAQVALLMTEDWNEPAQRQVTAVDFRETARWLRAFRTTVHSGRVDQRPEPAAMLQRAPTAEVGPAWVAWSGGELNRAARGMMAVRWQWRRLHPEDLERAADHGALFAGPTGWAIGAPRDNYVEIGWIQTTPERALDHFEALIEAAVSDKATAVEIMMPAVPWLEEAAATAAFEREHLLLFEKAL